MGEWNSVCWKGRAGCHPRSNENVAWMDVVFAEDIAKGKEVDDEKGRRDPGQSPGAHQR